MFAALKNRLKPPPENADDLPDAERVEAELNAAAQAEGAARHAAGPFRMTVTDRGMPCFEDRFDSGDIVVGADPECDIVITDIDAPEVLVIRLERIGAAGMITLTALCHGVIARERELPVGRPVRFPDRARFAIASDYGFGIELMPEPEPLVRTPSGPVTLLVGALLLALAGWLLAAPLPRPVAPDPSAAVHAPSPEATPQVIVPQIVTPADEVAPSQQALPQLPSPDPSVHATEDAADVSQELVDRLRMRLVDANLAPPLIVRAEAEGILVSGLLSAGERERAIDVMQAFRDGTSVTLMMEITLEPRPPPFFTAVALRPETFAIGADGRRYEEGQSLPDGGRIEKIDENMIVVNRDGLLERVSYIW